jgi:hypothetical protein
MRAEGVDYFGDIVGERSSVVVLVGVQHVDDEQGGPSRVR